MFTLTPVRLVCNSITLNVNLSYLLWEIEFLCMLGLHGKLGQVKNLAGTAHMILDDTGIQK